MIILFVKWFIIITGIHYIFDFSNLFIVNYIIGRHIYIKYYYFFNFEIFKKILAEEEKIVEKVAQNPSTMVPTQHQTQFWGCKDLGPECWWDTSSKKTKPWFCITNNTFEWRWFQTKDKDELEWSEGLFDWDASKRMWNPKIDEKWILIL